jgi:hypothetical protein
MRPIHLLRPLCLSVLVSLPVPGACAEPAPAGELPAYTADDPRAAAVTRENLFASERFWPYQVALVGDWTPAEGARPIPSGSTGVLVRMETGERTRIDFGRDGIHSVPLAQTDLLERANRVRRGELSKTAPNFVLALGPRLVDPAADPIRPFPLAAVFGHPGFLSVFADSDQLESMALALAPLAGRHGVLTLVLPQGEVPDARIGEQLRRLGWRVPFVYDHLAEAYTPSLLSEGLRMPAVMLQTAEGRVLFQSTWGSDVGARLAAALEAEFGAEPAP